MTDKAHEPETIKKESVVTTAEKAGERSSLTKDSQSPKKGLAITGLSLGIAGLVLAFVIGTGLPVAIAAVVISTIVLVKRRPGKGMAIAGAILGGLGIIISIIAIIVFAIIMNNVRQDIENRSNNYQKSEQKSDQQSDDRYSLRGADDSILRKREEAANAQKKTASQMKERYEQIQNGMTKDQVRSLTGEPLHIRNGVSSKTGGKVEVYQYPTGAPSTTKANRLYYVVLQDNSVIAKFDSDQLRNDPSLAKYMR